MNPRRSTGFTLLEVLVALLVLAIVMAASMAAQLSAMRMRQGSALLSSAAHLAGSVAERMRANPGSRALYLALDYDAVRDGPPLAGDGCYGAAACGGAALAAHDLDEIRQAVHQAFPGGRIVVCRDAGVGQGAMAWSCSGTATAPVAVKVGWAERGRDRDAPARLAVALMADGGAP